MESIKRLYCGSRYNAWTCTREPGHSGKHTDERVVGGGITWGGDSDAPVVSENPALYGTTDYSKATVVHGLAFQTDRPHEGAENRFHRAGTDRLPPHFAVSHKAVP